MIQGGDNGKLNSLDILEECFNSIHRCRKNSLLEKINRQSGKINPYSRGDKITSAQPDKQKFISTSTLRQDSGAFLKTSLTRQPHHVPEPVEVSSSDSIIPESKSMDTRGPQHTRGPSKKSALESKAEDALSSLRKEVFAWCSKNPDQVEDEDARADFADYLTEKYLCNILDPMPPSPIITAVRKQLSADLDDFVSVGPSAISSMVDDTEFATSQPPTVAVAAPVARTSRGEDASKVKTSVESTKPMAASTGPKQLNKETNKKTEKSVTTTTTAKQNNKFNRQDAALKNLEDRKLAEKEKIKLQYEQYRKIKEESEEAERSDNAKKVEENLNDIRSLLSSIQAEK